MSQRQQAETIKTDEKWPRPLPVLLAPACDEALSSWLARHAAYYGVSRRGLLQHCAPDLPSLHLLDRTLTPGQEARLAHLFRIDCSTLRRMTHAELDSDMISHLVALDIDHWCKPCAGSLAEAGFPKAVLRAWFHTWRITCARCGSRVLPSWRNLSSSRTVDSLRNQGDVKLAIFTFPTHNRRTRCGYLC